MNKRLISGFLSLIIIFTAVCPLNTNAAPSITVTIDGAPVSFETPPQIINDRIMVQIRAIAERLGCTVEWDGDTQTSYINQSLVPLNKIAVKGSDINVYVNNKKIDFPDQKPVNYEGYILIPSRGVVEALGYTVSWDDSTQTQSISTNTLTNAIKPQTAIITQPPKTEAKPSVTPTLKPKPTDPPVPPAPAAMDYVGNKNSKIFHYSDCSSVSKMKASNKVNFSLRDSAIKAGYRPCQNCNP